MSNLGRAEGLTVDAKLAGEAHSPVMHDYLAGEVFAITAAGEAQVSVAGNVFALPRLLV